MPTLAMGRRAFAALPVLLLLELLWLSTRRKLGPEPTTGVAKFRGLGSVLSPPEAPVGVEAAWARRQLVEEAGWQGRHRRLAVDVLLRRRSGKWVRRTRGLCREQRRGRRRRGGRTTDECELCRCGVCVGVMAGL